MWEGIRITYNISRKNKCTINWNRLWVEKERGGEERECKTLRVNLWSWTEHGNLYSHFRCDKIRYNPGYKRVEPAKIEAV